MAHDPLDGLEVGQVPLRHVHQLGGVYLVGEVGRAVLQRGRVFILVAVFLGMGTTEASRGPAQRLGPQAARPSAPPLPPPVRCARPRGLTSSSPSLSSSPLAPLSPPSPQPPLPPGPGHLPLLPAALLCPAHPSGKPASQSLDSDGGPVAPGQRLELGAWGVGVGRTQRLTWRGDRDGPGGRLDMVSRAVFSCPTKRPKGAPEAGGKWRSEGRLVAPVTRSAPCRFLKEAPEEPDPR